MRLMIWFFALVPALFVVDVIMQFELLGAFPNDPMKYISDITGTTALVLLTATLAISPLYHFFKYNFIKYRRVLGLFTFVYALGHFGLYLALEYEFDVLRLLEEALDKKFIFFGLFSFVLLLFLALTSTKKAFKRFRKGHRLIYIAAIFTALHAFLSFKIITVQSVLYLGVLLFFVVLRFYSIDAKAFKALWVK